MGFKTFIVTVRQWDFDTDEGVYIPTERERKYMANPFVVLAYDDIDAMNKVSDRVGWCIVDCTIDSL